MTQWVYHFAEHPSGEALTSPEQTTPNADTWQLFLREHQQIPSLPCSFYLVKLTGGLLPFNSSTGTFSIKDGIQAHQHNWLNPRQSLWHWKMPRETTGPNYTSSTMAMSFGPANGNNFSFRLSSSG